MTVQAARVKVCIPTFNRSELLRQAVESVLAQTYADFVLEIWDNASTDGTDAVVASFPDPRVTYHRQLSNVGLLENYRSCLAAPGSEYVLVMSDDDFLYSRFLERTVETLESHARVGLVHTTFDVVGENGEHLEAGNWTYGLEDDTIESSWEFIRESMRWSCRVCASTALIRTRALPQNRLDERDFPAVDFGLWLRIAAGGWDVAFLGEALAAYRIHPNAHSAAQLGPAQAGGYLHGMETVALQRALKLRFLRENGKDLPQQELLADLIGRCARWETTTMVKKRTLDRRRLPFRRMRFLAQAARLDPAALVDSGTWRILATDAAGPRGRALLRRAVTQTKLMRRGEAAGR